jgi:rare lipoprotein A
VTRLRLRGAMAMMCALTVAGCSHKQQNYSARNAPNPPVLNDSGTAVAGARAPAPDVNAGADSSSTTHYVEVGLASWYGPPYHNRRAANGEIYNQNQLSAAHRTLPMGSVVRVTNLKTGQSAELRITDRGPFVPNRMIDLSMGAAKELGVYVAGVARVKVELISAPRTVVPGGRWCVQIGAFKDADEAQELKDKLQHKFGQAQVLEFTGPTGHWVRIRPPRDDHSQAVQIAEWVRPAEGNAYLVRLD